MNNHEVYDRVQSSLRREDNEKSEKLHLQIYVRVAKDPENEEELQWKQCNVTLDKKLIKEI